MKKEQNISLSIFKESLAKMNPDLEGEKIPLYHQKILFISKELKENIDDISKSEENIDDISKSEENIDDISKSEENIDDINTIVRKDYNSINNTINNLLITLGFNYSGEKRLQKIEEFYQYAFQQNNNNDEINITDLDKMISKFNDLIKKQSK